MECNRQAAAMGLPELIYPVPVIVRNTFIDTPLLRRSDSLEEFLKERKAFSCPASAEVEHREEEAVEQTTDDQQTAYSDWASDHQDEQDTTFSGWASGFQALAGWLRPSAQESSASSNYEPDIQQTLDLSQALGEPRLGSDEVPTVGSINHHLRLCKPCAFVHTKGCESGVQCSFCHLCAQGEKKIRKKEKQAARKEARHVRQQRDPMVMAPVRNPGLQTFAYFW